MVPSIKKESLRFEFHFSLMCKNLHFEKFFSYDMNIR